MWIEEVQAKEGEKQHEMYPALDRVHKFQSCTNTCRIGLISYRGGWMGQERDGKGRKGRKGRGTTHG